MVERKLGFLLRFIFGHEVGEVIRIVLVNLKVQKRPLQRHLLHDNASSKEGTGLEVHVEFLE
jgi:hypothetical protein